jgi:menaquinol-cytochrome c reductase iron-sulfur subunit
VDRGKLLGDKTERADGSMGVPPEPTGANAPLFEKPYDSAFMERRSFLALATMAGGTAAAGVVAGPALLTLLTPAFASREPVWVRVAELDQFTVGTVHHAIVEVPRDDRARSLRHVGVYVLRTADADATVFSRTCTDLGCPIAWDPGSGWFFCPCHGGIFARDGSPQAGPPKRPLYRYATRLENGVLLIDLNSVPPMA